jgi:hypothetical protein
MQSEKMTILLGLILTGGVVLVLVCSALAADDGDKIAATGNRVSLSNEEILTVTISGPEVGLINALHTFTAMVSPSSTAFLPLTYTWQTISATSYARVAGLIDTEAFSWTVTGVQTVTAMVANMNIRANAQHTITIIPVYVYLPLVLRRWPPSPYMPTLHPIENADGDGSYTVNWEELPNSLAITYTLQEATNAMFAGEVQVFTTSQQSYTVTNRAVETYYYRTRGHNNYGDGHWSASQMVSVLDPQAEIRAKAWLIQQTNFFARVEDIPGYGREGCKNQVARYKDIVVCYPAISGAALVSFDYCNYGTPDQRLYMGKYGRAFVYDQAVDAIAWLMNGEIDRARQLLDYLSSYQNLNVPVVGAADGSFGFSFNTVGCPADAPNNRDSFYDMNYLRSGANAWVGYAFVMYQRMSGDARYLDTAVNIADYLLTQQVTDPNDNRFGLVRGGFGYYDTITWEFHPISIEWVSIEHNIDTYFFLRDLGIITGDTHYSIAAQRVQEGMLSQMWDDEKGRFNQGLSPSGEPDPVNALDAASWGAIFLLAVDENEKAQRSLKFAQQNFYNFADGLWGYKPYAGEVEGVDWDNKNMVWSEGSLGVAMAYLKLGGTVNQNWIGHILVEMTKLQSRDPSGGLMYAVQEGDNFSDFPKAPAVAGTAWFVMNMRAWYDTGMRDVFWGP